MNTRARTPIGLISVAVAFSVALGLGNRWWTGNQLSPGQAFAGPTSDRQSDEARRRSDDLLGRARQAMAENDLAAAESLLSQAEALGVRYGTFYRGDTPAKLRRDLQRMQKASGTAPTRPSQLFSPLSLRKKPEPVTDPFAARRGDAASAILPDEKSVAKSHIFRGRKELAAGNLTAAQYWCDKAKDQNARFGPHEDSPEKLAADIDRQRARTGPAGGGAMTGVTPLPPTSARPQAEELLLAARRALAEGDVNRANDMLQRAKALNVSYRPLDDSPAKVEADIRSYTDLTAQKAERGGTQAYRSQYARVLMEQAEGLLRHEDYDKAEHLAMLAAQQGVTFGPYQPNPNELLGRIEAQRRAGRGPASSASFGPGAAAPSMAAKQQAVDLVRQARAALAAGDLRRAEDLARQADRMQVPHGAFGLGEDRPDLVLMDIQKAAIRSPSQVVPAGNQQVLAATGASPYDRRASQAVYNPATDPTWNRWATMQEPVLPSGVPTPAGPRPAAGATGTSVGHALFRQGEAALNARDTVKAMQYFRQAAAYSDEFDPVTAQRLQDRLQLLGAVSASAPSMIDEAAAAQQRLLQQVAMDLAHQETDAKAMRQTDPKGALALLQQARQRVETAGLEPAARERLLARVDRSLAEMQKYIDENQARIDLEEQSRRVREEIQREDQMTLDVQQKLAAKVEEYNQLIEQQRFAEAEVVAKQAAELDPDNPFAVQILKNAKFIRRYWENLALQEGKERGFWTQMNRVAEASMGFDDEIPLQFGDATEWRNLTMNRRRWLQEQSRRRSERELEIEQKLKTPVLLQFQNAPLSQVMDYLARMAAVNLHLDPQGLAELGVTTEEPITINLPQEISLKSALNNILEPLGLSYVIKDEVLKITNEQLCDGEVYTWTYSVADLVVPIPNFIPNANIGLAGAYHHALGSVGFGNHGPFGGFASPLAVVATRDGTPNGAALSPNVLAQMTGTQPGAAATTMPVGLGPGGMGGGAMADFDSLIQLITSTVQPDSWDDVGGPGSIAPFENNLSLVISQTQEVHEEIADLLEQLRRLQDLQVTIEVRFITLNDNFFERIGVDFDFDLDDDIDRPFMIFGREVDEGDPEEGEEPLRNTLDVDHDRSVTVGLQSPGLFSADLDIPFTQNSFGLAVPQFGGFDPQAGASLGFAILSDIEAFFFINAAQGDRRSNVLQAPRVTMFNGQMASINDTSQSPFVISVVPVVGDFAAAQQPVIVILSEGTFLSVQAVVTDDRRFVRLTVVPFFSRIDEVNTFTFEGAESTSESSSSSKEGNQDEPDENTRSGQESSSIVSRSGTTVQLPTFSSVSVQTTVSVPDGGTVLLGGIKRLSEGRSEFGVPMLSKLPYISRLFKNVGIGRETQSLMMTVTPRIIIQEEEEEKLGIVAGP